MSSFEPSDAMKYNARVRNDADDTEILCMPCDDCSLFSFSRPATRPDDDELFRDEDLFLDEELLRCDLPMVALPMVTEKGCALASHDSMALRESSSKSRVEKPAMQPDDEFLGHYLPSTHNLRRERCRILQTVMLLVLVTAGIFTMAFISRRNEIRENRDTIADLDLDLEGSDNTVIPAPSGDLPALPTAAPTAAPTMQVQTNLAYQIISKEVEDPSLLLDPTTPQGKAFQIALEEGRTDAFRILQRFALMVFYFSTGGEETWRWRIGWMDFSEDECSWMGVRICRMQENGHKAIAHLSLSSNGLAGSLPSEICLLKEIENIALPDNLLNGELPSCLSSLAALEEIDVNNNQLSGSLPEGLFHLSSLETLVFSNNQFSGDLDALLAGNADLERNIFVPAFGSLKTLRLENNNFRSKVPDEFFSLSQLQVLTLHGNELEGNVDALCNRNLSLLTADCQDVVCSCCTLCF